MASRQRRNTTRPVSYKAFNETGAVDENFQDEQLIHGTMDEESRGAENRGNDQHAKLNEDVDNSIDQENIKCLVSLADHLMLERPKSTSNVNSTHAQEQVPEANSTQAQDTKLDLYVNPDKDDFEQDIGLGSPCYTGNSLHNLHAKQLRGRDSHDKVQTSGINTTIDAQQMFAFRDSAAFNSLNSFQNTHSFPGQWVQNTQMLKLDFTKQSKRQPSATIGSQSEVRQDCTQQTAFQPVIDLISDNTQEESVEIAEQAMLQHVQRETIRQQNTNNRGTPRRSVKATCGRKPKSAAKMHGTKTVTQTSTQKSVITHDDMQQKVQKVKERVQQLNPIRRARQLQFSISDGNPNVPGEDNGLNAWFDSQLNDDLTVEETVSVNYAKRNSDNNRCFDIDDVPMRGPHAPKETTENHPLQLKYSNELAEQAKRLINDDNISICRDTGLWIVRPKTTQGKQGDPRPKNNDRSYSHNDQANCNSRSTAFDDRRQDRCTMSQNRNWTHDRYENHDDNDAVQDPELYQHDHDTDRFNDYYFSEDDVPQYWHDESPQKVYYRNPEPYDDQPFHFRSQVRSPRRYGRDHDEQEYHR